MSVELYLKERGYTEPTPDPIYREEALCSYKKWPATKHQICVKRWSFAKMNNGRPAFDVEMNYETELGIWATVKFYGIAEDELLNVLPDLESRLMKTVAPMRANPSHYRYDGED